jgi:nitrous oxide reductase accessory protein NosL
MAKSFIMGGGAQMKSSSKLILAAVMATALLAACKKPAAPPPPAPEPKADAAQADTGPGKTTNFENPPAATEPAKPAGQ